MSARNPDYDEPRARRSTGVSPRTSEPDPELGFLLRCQELLERAHAVGTRIDERFRQAIGSGTPVLTPASGAAAGLAKLLLRRLLDGERPPERPA
jgi:hypothetical protein